MNVVCCWPRGKPDKVSIGACRENLKAQLDVVSSHVLVCGRVALNALLPHATLQHASAKMIPVHGKVIYPIIHPSYFLHKPDETKLMDEWRAQIARFALILFWGGDSSEDRCVYCDGPGFPACRKHMGTWREDNKWRVPRKRSKKTGLQDEQLFG
jgi:hypothetical protein